MRRLVVRELAMAKNFSMAKLEREAHLDRQTARRLWRNPSYNARPATLEKVATALGVHASELFREESEEEEDVVSSPLPDIPTIFTPPLTEEEAARQARVLKALAEPTRLWILSQLNRYERLMNVKELASVYRTAKSTISTHLQRLQSVGLISHYRDEQWVYYYLNRENVRNVAELLMALIVQPSGEENASAIQAVKDREG